MTIALLCTVSIALAAGYAFGRSHGADLLIRSAEREREAVAAWMDAEAVLARVKGQLEAVLSENHRLRLRIQHKKIERAERRRAPFLAKAAELRGERIA